MLSDKQILQIKNDAEEMGISKPYLNVVAFARAVEQAAYAAAIKACESLENRVISTHPARIEFDPNSLMARKCVGAIRLLMQENTDAAR